MGVAWISLPSARKARAPSAHFHDAIATLSPDQQADRTAVNEAVRLAEPDVQRKSEDEYPSRR
jgi:hypothetical protein